MQDMRNESLIQHHSRVKAVVGCATSAYAIYARVHEKYNSLRKLHAHTVCYTVSVHGQDPPVTAGCTAAQIRDNATQIIGTCYPRTDSRLLCCRRVMSKLVLKQPVLGELYALHNEKSSTSASISANTSANTSATTSANTSACGSSVLDTTPPLPLTSMSVLKCKVWYAH